MSSLLAAVCFMAAFSAHAIELSPNDKLAIQIKGVQFFQPDSVEFTPGTIDFYARTADSKFQFVKCKRPANTCEYVSNGHAFTVQEIANGLYAVSWVGLYDFYGAFPAIVNPASHEWYRSVPFVRGFAKANGSNLINLLMNGGSPISQDALGFPSDTLYLLLDIVFWYRDSVPVLN